MQTFLISTVVVALGEIGDKTQLLSLILAARFRKPLPIILGILAATLVNHAGAGLVGAWLSNLIRPDILVWVMGGAFIAMGLWILIPDQLDGADVALPQRQISVFFTTFVAFFAAEMGDKTQLATVALAIEYHPVWMVILGTTCGMMLADVPVVYLGNRFAERLPTRFVHSIAAGMFVVMGLMIWVKPFL